MSTISSQEIISIIKSEIENYDMQQEQEQETGFTIWVGDGITIVYNINHTMYGETVILEDGIKRMVQDIQEDEIGCILFGKDTRITEGTEAVRIKKKAGIPVGNGFVGRVINVLGEPISGSGPVKEEDYRPIKQEAPGIVDRKSVGVPMETGVLAIGSMFPIGRGQRGLVIGDKQTGKMSVTMDAILNQKGKDVICIYVAVGRKASAVVNLVVALRKHDAMDYTIVSSFTASEPTPLQYIAPHSSTTMAEYFMHQGKDMLIIYDDLSEHAVVYRALSLLLERLPGRETHPGDVFYPHPRLPEHSSRLDNSLGGDSTTALPVIGTQAGDVSAYTPADIISTTGDQILLENDLFFFGQHPAVDVRLSVSRVGGATQTKTMKKTSGSIRIDLAQYREMEVFTQFNPDLDTAMKEQLVYGKCLVGLFKQPLGGPLDPHKQVIVPCAATGKAMLDVGASRVKGFQMGMLAWFDDRCPEVGRELEESIMLSNEPRERIAQAAGEHKQSLSSTKG